MLTKIKPVFIVVMAVSVVLIINILILPMPCNAKEAAKVTITDMVGRQVTIHENVNKIVTTFKPVTLCILSLGLQDKIIGIDTHSKRDKLTLAVFPKVATLTGVGSKSTGLNFETIVSLKPDLVVLYAQKDGQFLANRLELMGIASLIILPESFESIQKSMEIIAMAVGEPEKAKHVEAVMDGILSQVDERIKTVPASKRKNGYFASPRGLFSTAAGNMLQDNIMERAGVVNVARELKGYFQDVSPEQFIAWNPDIVILSRNLDERTLTCLDDPAFHQVLAIRTKAVYRFPSNLVPWDFPSPLSALATLWVAQKAYPDIFADIDLAKQSNEFHKKLFDKTFQEMDGSFNELIFQGQGN